MKTTKSFVQHFVLLAVAIITISLSSCSSKRIIPTAINTVNAVHLSELNLERKDYNVLNTITAEAVVKARMSMGERIITEANDEFTITYTEKKQGFLSKIFNPGEKVEGYDVKCKGIIKFGYLSNGYARESISEMSAEEIAIRTAKYRLINLAQQNGADGIIEPIISTNIEQIGKEIVIKTVAQGKPIILKND